VLTDNSWGPTLKKYLPDFEKKTGIHVNIEPYGEDQLTQKLSVEFVSGSSNIDVFEDRPLQEGKLFAKNGWYADLNQFIKDPKKTPADWDANDFAPSAMNTVKINGIQTSLPLVVEHEVLYYRKDLLQQAGISVPKTLDELKQAAAKLTVPGKQFGFIARGQQVPLVTQVSSFLYSYGGDWYNQSTHQATLNSPAAVSAFSLYGNLLRNYGPPGVTNMSWPQAVAVFGQGKVALYTDADSIYRNLLDPAKSKVANVTGVAPFPAGPNGAHPYSICSWGLAMSANAPHKDAAWEFIKWTTSKETQLTLQGKEAIPGARNSVYAQAAGTAKFPKDWLAAAQAETKGQQYDRPLVTQVVNAREIVGSVVIASIEGKDVQAAAEQANGQFQALLNKETK
jgi:multiple sugar transport system substrate-binding protein